MSGSLHAWYSLRDLESLADRGVTLGGELTIGKLTRLKSLLLLLTACPYGFAGGGLPSHVRTVAVVPFEPGAVASAFREVRPTTMFCVPTHLQRLFAHWDEVGAPDLSSFRLVAHAGAPCPPEVKRRLIASRASS